MHTLISRVVATAALALTASFPLAAHAGFTGDSATFTYNSFAFTSPVVFASPQTVGGGIEFTGQGIDVFGQNWNFMADIFDTGLTLSMTESTRPGNAGNLFSNPDTFGFDLSFANSAIPPLMLTNFQTTSAFGGGSRLTSITPTGPNSVHFGFGGLYSGDQYTISAVPEPETYALMLGGLGLLAFVARRRQRGS